jgi:hypothetical protein
MSSRPANLLARHNASRGLRNTHPMLMMERDAAARALRLLRAGTALSLTVALDIQSGPACRLQRHRQSGRHPAGGGRRHRAHLGRGTWAGASTTANVSW